MEKYKIVRNVLNNQTIELLKNIMSVAKDATYISHEVSFDNVNKFSDGLPNSFPIANAAFTEGLLLTLLPLMEKETGVELYPTYSYCRIYWNGSDMFKHIDRPSCEYSVTVSVSIDPEPWPIWIEGEPVILYPGDIAIYKGCEVEHWRETYTGNQQCQIFLHYVDKHGPYAAYKFDQRPSLGLKK